MKNIVEYKGYIGQYENIEGIWHGKLIDVDDLVTFEGFALNSLITAFYEAVEDYLDTCRELGKKPSPPKTCDEIRQMSDISDMDVLQLNKVNLKKRTSEELREGRSDAYDYLIQ
jgi:hypothetical protein